MKLYNIILFWFMEFYGMHSLHRFDPTIFLESKKGSKEGWLHFCLHFGLVTHKSIRQFGRKKLTILRGETPTNQETIYNGSLSNFEIG
jgi:hypothetical protein